MTGRMGGQYALSSACVSAHLCSYQPWCFGQGRGAYGNVLCVQTKVSTCALDSMRLFVHLSHPLHSGQHQLHPPFFSLCLFRAQSLTICPLSACVSCRLPDVWVNETERCQLKTKVVHLSQLPQDTAILLDPNIYR